MIRAMPNKLCCAAGSPGRERQATLQRAFTSSSKSGSDTPQKSDGVSLKTSHITAMQTLRESAGAGELARGQVVWGDTGAAFVVAGILFAGTPAGAGTDEADGPAAPGADALRLKSTASRSAAMAVSSFTRKLPSTKWLITRPGGRASRVSRRRISALNSRAVLYFRFAITS